MKSGGFCFQNCLFRIVLAILGLWWFHINFRIIYSSFVKNIMGFLCLLASSLVRCLFRYFIWFFHWIICVYNVDFWVLCIFWVQVHYQKYFANISSQSLGSPYNYYMILIKWHSKKFRTTEMENKSLFTRGWRRGYGWTVYAQWIFRVVKLFCRIFVMVNFMYQLD